MSEQFLHPDYGAHYEKVVASLSKTLTEVLTERGFFSVLDHAQYTTNLFTYLENNFAGLLTDEVLQKYLPSAPETMPDASTDIRNLRTKIMTNLQRAFVDGDSDFVNRFNKECRDIFDQILARYSKL